MTKTISVAGSIRTIRTNLFCLCKVCLNFRHDVDDAENIVSRQLRHHAGVRIRDIKNFKCRLVSASTKLTPRILHLNRKERRRKICSVKNIAKHNRTNELTLGNTPCVQKAETLGAPARLSASPHSNNVPPDCTKSSTTKICFAAAGFPSFQCSHHENKSGL